MPEAKVLRITAPLRTSRVRGPRRAALRELVPVLPNVNGAPDL
jgi:hypothetical protein